MNPLVKFADVISLSSSRTADPASAGIERFVGLEHIEPENLHIRSWGLVADGITFTSTFKRGQVLFGKRRAYQRKVAVADFDGVCSSDIYVFESKDPNVLLPELVPFILQSEGFYEYAVKTSAGSLSPRTNWTHLANYEFPLPPVDEQRRIADLLWAIDETKQKWVSVIQAQGQLIRSYQKIFFPLTSDSSENKSSWHNLDDLCIRITDGKHGDCENQEGSGYYFVSAKDIMDDGINFDNARQITQDSFQEAHKRTRLEPGDILVSNSGTIGKVAIVNTDPKIYKTTFQKSVAIIKPNKEHVMERWLFYCIQTKHELFEYISQGSAQKNLLLKDLRNIKILIPSMEEQAEIVTQMDRLFDVQNDLKNHMNLLGLVGKELLKNF